MVQFHQKKNMKVAACLILFFVCLFSLPLRSVKDIHAHTSAQRNGLEPHQIGVSRERYLKAAAAHVNQANQLGYAESNSVLSGTSYVPLSGSSVGFSRVSLLTHVIYTATASIIDGKYHPIAQTLETEHDYADSNGLVFDASAVAGFRGQLMQANCLYKKLDKSQPLYSLKLGDIVLTGPSSSNNIGHSVLVLGTITEAENAFMNIPDHHPDEVYFITMGTSERANYRAISALNTTWHYDDPHLGHHVKEIYRPLYSIVDQDMGGFRFQLLDGAGKGLSGATFLFEGPNDYRRTIVMDSFEYHSEKTLPPGTYTLTETKAPLGYRVDQTPRTIEITMDTINSEYWDTPIVNEYGAGDVQVSNRDTATESPIQGAVFELSQCASFPSEDTIQRTTGEDGNTEKISFDCEKGVTVYARQVSVPSPYILDDSTKSIAVVVDQTNTVLFKNECARGQIKVTVQNETGQPIEGVAFNILKEGDLEEDTGVSDEQGVVIFEGLPLGTYTLQQIEVPKPFILNRSAMTIFLSYRDMNTPLVQESRTVVNTAVQGCIRVGKKDAIDETPLAGAVFYVFNDQEEQVDTITTGQTGEGVSKKLPLGTYTLKEHTAPHGYVLESQTHPVQLIYQDRDTAVTESYIEITNRPLSGYIAINCMDEATTTPIQGACFKLLGADKEAVLDLDGEPVGILESQEDGMAVTPPLRPGCYLLQQLSVPDAFYPMDETIEGLLLEDTETVIVEVCNERVLLCVDILLEDGTTGEKLEAGVFQILDDMGDVLFCERFPIGCYTIRQTKAPNGYVSSEDVIFTIDRETDYCLNNGIKTCTVSMTNQPTQTALSIRDKATGKMLLGANLQLLKRNTRQVVDEWTSAAAPRMVKQLEVGSEYILRALQVPEGYTPPIDRVFTVANTSDTQSFAMETSLTCCLIHKTDELGAELKGVEFELYSSGEQPLLFVWDKTQSVYIWKDAMVNGASSQLVTDEEGFIRLRGLPLGDYELYETKEAPGYIRNEAAVTLTVDELSDEAHPVEIVNTKKEEDEIEEGEGMEERPQVGETVSRPDPTVTNILIQKIDAEAPDVFLEGAVFELYPDTEDEDVHALCFSHDGTSYVADDAGTITRLVSDTRGQIQLMDIPLGAYRLVECEAPEGYAIDPDVLMFDIDEEHSSVQLVFENHKIVLGIDEGEDTLDKIPVPGERTGAQGGICLVFAALLLGMFFMKQALDRFEECRSSSDRQ